MVPPSLGTWGLSDQRQKHLDCAMPCPPAPAQFMNTPHRAGQLLRSLEPTTFSLKSRGLSKISVGPVSLGIEPGDPLLLGCSLYSSTLFLTEGGSGYAGYVLS